MKYSKDGKRLLKGAKFVKYKIKEGTSILCDSAFESCESLQKIIIPPSVKNIGNRAFGFCHSLQEIIIPESIISIGDEVFRYCNLLNKITFPISLKKIGKNPFIGCKCVLVNYSPHFIIKNNVLYNSDMTVLISYLSTSTTFIIPSSVTNIGNSAFESCELLKEITIPQSVISIGNNAFNGCI